MPHRRSGQQELLARGFGRRRRTRCRDLQPDRHGQTQRSRPGQPVSETCCSASRRSSDQPHLTVAALERRHKRAVRNARGRINEDAARKGSTCDPLRLPNIAELIEDGEITVGVLDPVGCVAVSNDGARTLARLVGSNGETVMKIAVVFAASTAHRKRSYAPENGLFLLRITPICSIFVRIPGWAFAIRVS